jgi:hypothetical protein
MSCFQRVTAGTSVLAVTADGGQRCCAELGWWTVYTKAKAVPHDAAEAEVEHVMRFTAQKRQQLCQSAVSLAA